MTIINISKTIINDKINIFCIRLQNFKAFSDCGLKYIYTRLNFPPKMSDGNNFYSQFPYASHGETMPIRKWYSIHLCDHFCQT